MSRKSITLILVSLFALSLVAAGCGGQKSPSQQPAAAKTLKVGAETTFPPFEFQDEKTKDYTGFDIDLMKAIGKQMGYEVQIASLGFDALIPALDVGQIDVIASAMTITDERSKKVSFSNPYYKSGLSIVVKHDNTAIQGFKDLAGKRIAVQIGTTGSEEAKKIKDAKVREFNSASEAYMELKAGGVDAVVNDLPVNQYYLAQGGAKDAKIIGEVLNSENYGIAVSKKNTELVTKINKALDDLKANGEYAKIYEKWFGKRP
ncbi:glutamine ABC transporter substrate-binding protein [Anaerosporomusa subterranea]|uniref:Glutamine ABC transporter substrate-binding protein n=1 Tax=Anaerosporomusa subterranea TaxID=1794912 RepID=A0A154BUK1_ANASB|nr:basic amino acid ABC transporter substrate-binding protein [Anaerosporomusa subterranea]KYZ77666.1 glutamine ABC transporter substrate-binding protein [Anaerosporomusa subterranea]